MTVYTAVSAPGDLQLASYHSSTPAGDLFYLQVTTLEGNVVHISATPSGFYVNKTSEGKFDPSPADQPCKGYTLVDTLKQV